MLYKYHKQHCTLKQVDHTCVKQSWMHGMECGKRSERQTARQWKVTGILRCDSLTPSAWYHCLLRNLTL